MKKSMCVSVALIVFLLAIPTVHAIGLSVIPAKISLSNLMKDQQYNIAVSVNNINDNTETFSLSSTGEISDWISFYSLEMEQINQITVPPNSVGKFFASLNIPKEAANRNYQSTIYIAGSTSNTTIGNASGLSLRVPIQVSLNIIGEQLLEGRVINISTTNTEINRLLRINVEFENTGNVVAKPNIEVIVKKNDVEVDNFTYNSTSVSVGNTSTIGVDWDTKGQTVGNYTADVKVLLDSKIVDEENVSFKIFERGTFTADGRIEEVISPSEVTTGQAAKIEVQFQNTGQIDLMAKISGEVYQDNNFVDTLQSDETLIKIGENGTLTAYFKPTKDGSYLIKSGIAYEGKKEPLNDITINAKGSSAFSLDTQSLIIIFVIIVIALIVAGIVYDVKKSKK